MVWVVWGCDGAGGVVLVEVGRVSGDSHQVGGWSDDPGAVSSLQQHRGHVFYIYKNFHTQYFCLTFKTRAFTLKARVLKVEVFLHICFVEVQTSHRQLDRHTCRCGDGGGLVVGDGAG